MTVQQNREQEASGDAIFCANHPNRETLLHCNRCGKPICLDCAVLTDVGYRCKECIRSVQDVYFNAQTSDYVIAFVVAFFVALIATPILGRLLSFLGLFFGLILAFMMGSGAGALLAQIIRTAIHRRRGRYLPLVTTLGIVGGVLVAVAVASSFFPLVNIPVLVFAFLAISTMYPFLR